MSLQTLLNRLDKVKKTTNQNWIACCPAHEDKSPSLSIREVDDGRILIHCFAGCPAESILNALELTFSDLHPERLNGDSFKSLKRIFNANTGLTILQMESSIVLETAKAIKRKEALSDESINRLSQCIERIERVCEAGGLA